MKKIVKSFTAVLLVICCSFTLSACGSLFAPGPRTTNEISQQDFFKEYTLTIKTPVRNYSIYKDRVGFSSDKSLADFKEIIEAMSDDSTEYQAQIVKDILFIQMDVKDGKISYYVMRVLRGRTDQFMLSNMTAGISVSFSWDDDIPFLFPYHLFQNLYERGLQVVTQDFSLRFGFQEEIKFDAEFDDDAMTERYELIKSFYQKLDRADYVFDDENCSVSYKDLVRLTVLENGELKIGTV